jgi:hypothetical protein
MISLDDKEDLEISEGIVLDIFYNYAIPFFQKNSALEGVLESLRSVNIFQKPRPNFIHSKHDEESILLELFLTQLLYPSQFEASVKRYREAIPQASEKHEIETGKKDFYLYLSDILTDGIQKIHNADWDKIRLELKGM